jgi:hypothetical protein
MVCLNSCSFVIAYFCSVQCFCKCENELIAIRKGLKQSVDKVYAELFEAL